MNSVFRIILILLLPLHSVAQSYNFLHFTVEDGLSNSTILNICEDKFGHLWFATQGGGLNRYDGHSFESITIRDGLASNFVRDVICDSKGNIWAATASGISRYDGKDIKNYLHDPQDMNSVNVIFEDREGRVWFSVPEGGVGFIQDDSITVFNQKSGFVDDVVIDINSDKESVWVMTNIKGLFRYDGEKFVHVLTNQDFRGYLLSISVRNDGKLLLGSNRGVLLFDPEKSDENNNIIPALQNYFIRTVTVDKDKNLWASLSNGAVKLGDDKIISFSEDQGFTSNTVNVIFSDREGTLWFGTEGDGVYKFSDESFFHLNKRHGLNGEMVTTIIEDFDDNLWIGTFGGGIDIYNGDSILNLDYDILSTNYITSSSRDPNGNMWFGTRDGLLKYERTVGFTKFGKEHGLINNGIKCIETDNQGRLWIGTYNGLSRFDGVSFQNITEEDGLSSNIIWQIIPAADGGVFIVTRQGIDKIKNDYIEVVSRDEEIFKKRLNVVLFDNDGNIWIGYSGHGIIRVEAGTKNVTQITTSEGLSSDFIYNMIWDDEKNLIVGTERGVDKIYLDENSKPFFIKNYGTVEGFKGLKTSPSAVYKENDGSVWFGSDKGLFKYQPEKARVNEVAPLTYISNLKLFYNEIDWSTTSDSITSWTHLPVNLKLDHDMNHIIFHYNGISLKNPKEVVYQFKLENLEDDWSPVTTKTEAAYTNLPPGTYSFKVRAANSDGVWSTVPASFDFTIKSPFWQEWWFYLLVALSLILLVKFYYEYHVRKRIMKLLIVEKIRSEELQNVRKRMARDFHDNMGNQLASITVYVNIISMKLKDASPEINDLLVNIEKHTKSLFTGTKDFIWSIDPESDEIHEIFTYIKDFGEELYHNTPKGFYSNISSELPVINLPSGYSRQIVLIFKEAMTNALKHSNGDKVYFLLEKKEDHLEFKLKDNGNSAPEPGKPAGKGLENMKSRAKQIGASLDINWGEGGFCITLNIKR